MTEHSLLFQTGHFLTEMSAESGALDASAPAVSARSSLNEVLQAFRAGAIQVAVYDDAAGKTGLRSVIDREALVAVLDNTVRLSGARLIALLESSFDAICMIDRQKQVILWNSQAENLYGIKKEEILGQEITRFFQNLVVTRVLQDRVPVQGAYHQPCPGTYVLINAFPILLDGEAVGSVSVERDITNLVLLNRELVKANNRASVLEQEIEKFNASGSAGDPFGELCGRSAGFRETVRLARKVAATDAAVLLCGESGTGKELFARALHRGGRRRSKPFVPLNCGAIPYNLFESELFGYEGGAFTGADKGGKPGKFALAHGGTLFLDEISELHPDLQVKLLRVLQDQVYYPVGGSRPRQVDVRIIAATNQDLKRLVQDGRFRRDLYYRLNVVTLRIPPLRERKNDIPELAYLFLAEFSRLHQKRVSDISPEVMTLFLRHHWSGNIRELRNVIERAVVLAEGDSLDLEALPGELVHGLGGGGPEKDGGRLARLKESLERDLIRQALAEHGGNKARAAAALGIPRSSLYYRLAKLGLGENN